jgi:hypothetical protein
VRRADELATAARTGIPIELLTLVRETIGMALPARHPESTAIASSGPI